MKYIIEATNLVKEYNDGDNVVLALKGVDIKIKKGEDAVIMGPSGSGKSTLLQLIGALDKPSSGSLKVADQDVFSLSDSGAAVFRNKTIGFVFQSFNLQPYNTAAENVALPLLLAGVSENIALEKANELLKKIGLQDRSSHLPSQLSGGEMQRIAIARALVNKPKIVLADEPTGNLDKDNAKIVLDLFEELSTDDVSFIIVTHDDRVAKRYKRVITLEDGEVK